MVSFPPYDEGDVAMFAAEDEGQAQMRDKWGRVMAALEHAYEQCYVHNDRQGFWRAICVLMAAYDDWLD